MATATGSRFDTASLTGLHWAGIALALLSGAVHLVLGVSSVLGGNAVGLGVAFVLAGVAFLVASAMVAANYRRRLLYVVGVPFVAVQIGAWYWLNYASTSQTLAQIGGIEIVDKAAQLALIAVLLVLYRREA